MYNELITKYENIINKYKIEDLENVLKRGYVFQYDENEKDADLLFIGINPSYVEKYEKGQSFSGSYSRSRERSYFKPFADISDQLTKSNLEYNGVWTHIDLLIFRETNQKFIDKLIKTTKGCEFIMEQLGIAKKRLKHIAPKVVVVSNTKARELIGKDRFKNNKTGEEYGVWMGLEFEFDEEFGVHKVLNIPELKDTYFVFSSMLSGQRALDIGSRERMIWQIKKIFDSLR